MAEKWTPAQLDAIEARGGSVLVSAAAGSGKTTVLVERIIRRIKNGELDVNELLVVTFTNAAAANMKTKISKALSLAVKEAMESGSDDVARLRRQQIMLPLAKISTIDSFCISLVRENFQILGVSPDFTLIDESRKQILRNEAVSVVMDDYYKNNPEGFERLCNLISSSRDDSNVVNCVLGLYDESQAYPFPDEYLATLEKNYSEQIPFEETLWGNQVYSYIEKKLEYAIAHLEKNVRLANDMSGVSEKYKEYTENEKRNFQSLLKLTRERTGWDELKKSFQCERAEKGRVPSLSGEEFNDLKILRNIAREAVDELSNEKKPGNIFVSSQENIYKDTEFLYPVIKCLTAMVHDFAQKYSELKNKECAADFNDTLHLAINLLCEHDENGVIIKDAAGEPVASAIAKELSEQFAEILVDEYQDVNKAQDIIFTLISRNNSNLFMVGDVKQSIYGFRQAMPELFLEKQKSYAPYDGKTFPATIVLGTNFRSRPGITENINHIFSRVMTEGIGDLEYNENHYLHHHDGGFAEKPLPDVEFHILRSGDQDNPNADAESEEEKTTPESDEINYIADYITSNVGVMQITGKDGERPARYGDFAVLMRSVKGYGPLLAEELRRREVPVICKSETDFFDSAEVKFMASLMRVMDNPLDDVSLLAVMLSPVYGFTPDEVAQIKIGKTKTRLCHCAVSACENGNEKCRALLAEINRLRKLSYTMGAAEYIQLLLDETGFYSIVSAMSDASAKMLNLRTLVSYAQSYEAIGRTGLPGFLRYLERAEETKANVFAQSPAEENADAVKIMTIHSSKGLEFPVTILARCFRGFYTEEQDVYLSRSCGIGMCSGGEKFTRYNTMQKIACKLEKQETERAEELRVLYVALTRAMEKLVIIGTINLKSRGTKLSCDDFSDCEKVHPYAVLSSKTNMSLLATALVNHIDANLIRQETKANCITTTPCAPLRVVTEYPKPYEADEEPEKYNAQEAEKLLEAIKGKLEYKYPYSSLDRITAKKVASDFTPAHTSDDYIASSRPAFMCKNELTPAQRGTATHAFMQHCTFDGTNIGDQLEHMVNEGLLSEIQADAVEMGKIEKFFKSELFRRVACAKKIYREQEFTCAIRADEVNPGLGGEAAEETIIVDGVVDLAFEEEDGVVIVDYKTDHHTTEDRLRELHGGQLGIYRRCLGEMLGKNVKETLIYSFYLGKTVKI